MSKTTYYIVQTSPSCCAHGDGISGFADGYGMKDAARLCFGRAQIVFRQFAAKATAHTPRRFPRIVKVTIETKTVKDRR